MTEPQEEEEVAEEEEEDEPEQVVVENESYVNLKKKLSRKYDMQAKSLYNENVKLCTQFRLKKVWYTEQNTCVRACFREINIKTRGCCFTLVVFLLLCCSSSSSSANNSFCILVLMQKPQVHRIRFCCL